LLDFFILFNHTPHKYNLKLKTVKNPPQPNNTKIT